MKLFHLKKLVQANLRTFWKKIKDVFWTKVRMFFIEWPRSLHFPLLVYFEESDNFFENQLGLLVTLRSTGF